MEGQSERKNGVRKTGKGKEKEGREERREEKREGRKEGRGYERKVE